VWRGLCADLPAEGAAGVHVDKWEGRRVAVRWQRCAPETVDELLLADDRAPARPAPVESNGFQQVPMELGAVPAPRALPLSRLSYSALEAYRRCGYRFYLERILGLPRSEAGRPPPGTAPPPREEQPLEAEGLPKLLRGSLVHKLLEELDLRAPVLPPDEQIAELILRHADEARPEDVADLRALLVGFANSELRERLARAERVRAELPFAFTLQPPGSRGRSLLVNGVVDVHAVEGDRTLVVDYKSDPLDGQDPAEYVAGHYEVQRTVYALAALKAGAGTVEVAYVLLERPDEPVTQSFEAVDAEGLEQRLLELGRGLVDGSFEPTAEPHRELCAGCPGQPALCSWPPEMTLRG